MENKEKYCGIDVSMDTLDVCYLDDNKKYIYRSISNNKAGFKELLKVCKGCHFVMESTGVYHLNLVFFLHQKSKCLALKMR